jgi:hypothetical protein
MTRSRIRSIREKNIHVNYNKSTFCILPLEMIQNVTRFLDLRSFINLGLTSKFFQDIEFSMEHLYLVCLHLMNQLKINNTTSFVSKRQKLLLSKFIYYTNKLKPISSRIKIDKNVYCPCLYYIRCHTTVGELVQGIIMYLAFLNQESNMKHLINLNYKCVDDKLYRYKVITRSIDTFSNKTARIIRLFLLAFPKLHYFYSPRISIDSYKVLQGDSRMIMHNNDISIVDISLEILYSFMMDITLNQNYSKSFIVRLCKRKYSDSYQKLKLILSFCENIHFSEVNRMILMNYARKAHGKKSSCVKLLSSVLEF